jgi:hypothetical protein
MTKDKKERSATEDNQRMIKDTRPTNKGKLPQGVTVLWDQMMHLQNKYGKRSYSKDLKH